MDAASWISAGFGGFGGFGGFAYRRLCKKRVLISCLSEPVRKSVT